MHPGASFFRRLTDLVLRRRWSLLLTVALLSALFVASSGRLRFDSSNEIWMVEGDRSLERMNVFKALFGNDDFVIVLHDAGGDFFRREPVQRFAALARDLEDEVPHVLDATWLGSAEWIEGREASIEIEPLLDPLPESEAELARARRLALSEPSFVDALISRDGHTAAVLLEMDAYPEDAVDPRKDVAPVVREILSRPQYADLPTVAVGGPIIDYDLDELAASEALRLGIVCLIVQMAVLAWVGRGIRGVLVPASVVVLSVAWTMGAIALLGFTLNMTVIMVPVLLICVGIGDSMHVIAEFNQERRAGLPRDEALRTSMALVGWPCVLTSLTTAAGFLSFLSTDIRPFRELGIYSALGVLTALALSLALVPALYGLGRAAPGSAARSRSHDVFDRVLRATSRLVVRRPRALVAAFVLLSTASLVGATRVEVETDVTAMFRKHVSIRRDIEWVDARMGGTISLELMLDTGEPDGILDPDFMRRLDALDRRVAEHPLTMKTVSILDVMRKMRKAFHENRDAYYGVPETREEASQYLLLYELSGGEERDKLVSFDGAVARLTARTRSLGTGDVKRFSRDVERWTAEIFGGSDGGGDVGLQLTGMMDWARAMSDLLARGQRASFAAALGAITLMMIAVLRSLRLGLISMVPNVFPVIVSLGLMGFAGIDMDIMTMGFSALIIGVAVDDTIHFFVRYRAEFERTGSYAEALEATLTTVGRPITFTTMTLTLGFSVMTFSQLGSLGTFGLLSCFAFAWALLADFLFAPALLLLLRPLGPETPRSP